MANLTIVAANVVGDPNATKTDGVAGVAITAGQVVFKNDTTGKWDLADNNAVAVATRKAVGIALNSASVNQPVEVQTAGPVTIGAAVTVGTTYYLSDTPGAIAPAADLATGEYVSILGVGISATQIALDINNSGVAVP